MKNFDIEQKVTAESLFDVLATDVADPNNRLRRLKKWADHQRKPDKPDTPKIETKTKGPRRRMSA